MTEGKHTPELLPCKFCEDESLLQLEIYRPHDANGLTGYAECLNCGARGPRERREDLEDRDEMKKIIVTAWNTRTPDPAFKDMLDALGDALPVVKNLIGGGARKLEDKIKTAIAKASAQSAKGAGE